jgi:polar amino acid transport system permease protein
MLLFFHDLSMPHLLEGIEFTVEVTALELCGGLILGVVFAAMQLSRFRVMAALARG